MYGVLGATLDDRSTRSRIPARYSYPIITLLSAALTWNSHIFEVVAYASRAFALYYLLQALVAARLASRVGNNRWHWRVFAYGLLALLMLAIVLFAVPVVET